MAFSKVGIATRSLLAPPPYIVNVAIEVLKLVEQIVLTPVDLESSKLVAVAFAPLALATIMRDCKVPIWDGVTVVEGWWSGGGAKAIFELGIYSLQEFEFGESHACKRDVEKLAFVLIDFEEGCFSLLSLFHISKKHMFVTCSRISLNTTAKVTPGCKV